MGEISPVTQNMRSETQQAALTAPKGAERAGVVFRGDESHSRTMARTDNMRKVRKQAEQEMSV